MSPVFTLTCRRGMYAEFEEGPVETKLSVQVPCATARADATEVWLATSMLPAVLRPDGPAGVVAVL